MSAKTVPKMPSHVAARHASTEETEDQCRQHRDDAERDGDEDESEAALRLFMVRVTFNTASAYPKHEM